MLKQVLMHRESYFCIKILIMIQRIQSVYLLVSVILTVLFAFLSFANFEVNGSLYFMKVMGLYYQDTNAVLFEAPNMSLSAVVFFSVLLTISAIFNFKKRSLQIRLVSLSVVAQLASVGLVFFAISTFPDGILEGTLPQVNYTFASFLPIAAVVFLVLALRAIKKDEKLIKSLDRIR